LPSRNRHWIVSGLRLESRDRARAIGALAWLVAAEMAVRVLPFSTLTRWMERVPPSRSHAASLTSSECGVAIRRAARIFPAGRCLARAVAASCLLRRAGRIATLNLGVGFDVERQFEAHAWLECDGIVVTGGDISDRYASIGAAAEKDP
jgi:hypothetical protein